MHPCSSVGLKDNVSLSVNPKELNKLIEAKGRNVLIVLKVDGDKTEARNVVLQEFQTHPLKPGWVHIDFLEIDVTKKIKAKIPVLLIGVSPGEKQGGRVNHIIRALEVESLPKDIPEKIEVEMGEVQLNEMIHVSDLNLGDAVSIVNNPNDVVVNVHLEKVKEEKTDEEVAEGEDTPADSKEDAGKKEDGKN